MKLESYNFESILRNYSILFHKILLFFDFYLFHLLLFCFLIKKTSMIRAKRLMSYAKLNQMRI